MPHDKERQDYINTFNRTSYQTITVRLRRPTDLPQRVQTAADAAGLSVNAWITRAICKQLEEEEHLTDDAGH